MLRQLHKDRRRVWAKWEMRMAELVDGGTPVERLWMAVLGQAMREAARKPWAGHRRPSAKPALRWFASGDDTYLGSFAAICREVGLPAGEIREYVMRRCT